MGTIDKAHQSWLTAIVESSDDAIAGKDLQGIVRSWNWGAEALFGYSPAEIVGRHISILAVPGREAEMPMILERIRRGEKVAHFETQRRRKDGGLVDISLTVSPVYDAKGRIIGASKIARDITERRRTERELLRLTNELNHRAKNALAVAQAMLRLTKADSIGEYVAIVQGRIAALARIHGQVAENRWHGTDLRTLAASELEPFQANTVQAEIGGPAVLLDPVSAQAVGIVLHELATNAIKFGALSVPGGAVAVTWHRDGARGDLSLRWSERNGPPASEPAPRRFGIRVIERQVPEQLGGSVQLQWLPAGLQCELMVPATHLLPSH